jgi:hypothetical protein
MRKSEIYILIKLDIKAFEMQKPIYSTGGITPTIDTVTSTATGFKVLYKPNKT